MYSIHTKKSIVKLRNLKETHEPRNMCRTQGEWHDPTSRRRKYRDHRRWDNATSGLKKAPEECRTTYFFTSFPDEFRAKQRG